MTLEQILEKLELNHKHLIPNTFNDKDYLAIYFSHASSMDLKYLGVDYSSLISVTDDLDRLEQIVTMCCYTHDYKWQKLYDINQVEYNPIWNVDGTETETHTFSERNDTNNYGANSATSINSSVPDDMTSEKEVNQNTSTRNAYSDTFTEGAHSETISKVRGGNIGVTMTQQLIEAERKIADNILMDIIYKDILEAIAIPMFN